MLSAPPSGAALLQTIFTSLIVTLALGLAAGSLYQWSSARAERIQYPAPGELIAVDDLILHLDCRGRGTPAIIIESGLMSDSTNWALVHDQLAQTTRVCAYDRAGMGWSEPAAEPVRADAVADRLHKLLDLAGEDGPKVLLGMSAGGVFVREYYQRHRESVVGMVLVDSSHEQQGSRLPVSNAASNLENMLTACSWLQPVGVVRAFNLLDESLAREEMPTHIIETMRANAYQSHFCDAMLLESKGFALEITNSEPPIPLGDLPLLVLSQGRPPEEDELAGFTPEQVTELQRTWTVLQQELTALSTQGRRVIATESGHLIQIEQPDLIIETVSAFVEQLRQH